MCLGWCNVRQCLCLRAVCITGIAILAASGCYARQLGQPSFTVVEATIPQMQEAMTEGRVTSRELTLQYLTRIAIHNSRLRAAITISPTALKDADARDRERRQGSVRGPLHGIPIALKDNIHTSDMPTTGGALAFENLIPPYEASLTKNLREAGAIIIAKTSMTELANWVAGAPTPMPSNYNALSGYGMNPYDSRRDPREATSDRRPALAPGGSSSGIGTAASLWAANVGTETTGSILSPASRTMLAAIKPTVGRISRRGVIPITADQDTPGPMAKDITDAAILFGALESASSDPQDSATTRCTPPPGRDYVRFLRTDALKGARIGIPRAFFYDSVTPPGMNQPRGGLTVEQKKIMSDAVAVLRRHGATILDPADIPSIIDPSPENNILRWDVCSGVAGSKGKDDECSVVLKYGMKRDFSRWLRSLGSTAPVKSLGELRRWNLNHNDAGAIKYGQSQLDISDEMDTDVDRTRYEKDRAKDLRLSTTAGIDAVMKGGDLDALLFPSWSGADIAARAGYPTVMVPYGQVPNAPSPPFPKGFEARPTPYGVSFSGRACSEPGLLAIAYAFEQATRYRLPPRAMQE